MNEVSSNGVSASERDERTFRASASSAIFPPAELSDAELLAATRRLVGRSNQLLASLLAHLAEVETRGIHRIRACSSLYSYCIYDLRFSEDEAYRRVTAARLVRRFPALLEAIAAGELHLTGLLMLGPHLTAENLVEVLARARHRTKKEIAGLVRMLDPLPDVPSRIEPLGPAPAPLVPPEPTWSQFARTMNSVRELAAGDRPRDWAENITVTSDGELGAVHANGAWRDVNDDWRDINGADARIVNDDWRDVNGGQPKNLDAGDWGQARTGEPALPNRTAPAPLTPQRYMVQFTASEEHVKLVEQAKALLSHSAPHAGLDEIHLRAMRALVTELERQKYAVTARPRQSRRSPSTQPAPPRETHEPHESARGSSSPDEQTEASERAQASECALTPMFEHAPARTAEHALVSEHASAQVQPSERERAWASENEQPRQRGRHVPAAIRRAVFARDEKRCTYTGDSGQRCRETQGLELHHSKAFARGGAHSQENLTLRCRAHNDLAAEEDFGSDYIALARDSTKHEPLVGARGGTRRRAGTSSQVKHVMPCFRDRRADPSLVQTKFSNSATSIDP